MISSDLRILPCQSQSRETRRSLEFWYEGHERVSDGKGVGGTVVHVRAGRWSVFEDGRHYLVRGSNDIHRARGISVDGGDGLYFS